MNTIFLMIITIAQNNLLKTSVQGMAEPFSNEVNCLKSAELFRNEYSSKFNFLHVECKKKKIINRTVEFDVEVL